MRLLLDECVTRNLKRDLVGHEVMTVVEAGYGGLKNGELLRAASGNFDVLITVDRNLPFQQNIGSLQIAVLIIMAQGITYPRPEASCSRRSGFAHRYPPGGTSTG